LTTPLSSTSKAPTNLPNPGDVKNCPDFANYNKSKAWFDKYYPLYSDVAELDGNKDGLPCESSQGAPKK
jgi:hypothetical protein